MYILMSRALRCAQFDSYGTYHIINRGSSDTIIFKEDKDKEKFLYILKKAQKIFNFTLYAYCLMNTHFHLLIYSNGANISEYMKYIQQCFAIYYNQAHERHGHVFADRFKSVPAVDTANSIISSAELSISAYIHTNPVDIPGYHGRMERYKYCSFGIYMGIKKDELNILNTDYILSLFNSSDKGKAKGKYKEFVYTMYKTDMKEKTEFESEPWVYKPGKTMLVSNYTPQQVFQFVSKYTQEYGVPYVKYNRKNLNYKAICIILMRSVCGFKLSEICSILGNITASNVWKLCETGLNIITDKYKNIMEDFISYANS